MLIDGRLARLVTNRGSVLALSLLMCVSASTISAAADTDCPSTVTPSLTARVPSSISEYTLTSINHLDLVETANSIGTVTIPFEDGEITLNVKPSTVSYEEVNVQCGILDKYAHRHFVAYATDNAGISARLSFDETGLTARIWTKDGKWCIDPAALYDPSVESGVVIVYRPQDCATQADDMSQDSVELLEGDESDTESSAGSIPSSTDTVGAQLEESLNVTQSTSRPSAPDNTTESSEDLQIETVSGTATYKRVLRILAFTDNDFRSTWSSPEIIIQNRVNMVNSDYEQVNIELQITGFISWNHAYDGSPSLTYLSDFRTYVKSQSGLPGRDVAVLFTSGNMVSAGAGYVRGVGTDYAYSVVRWLLDDSTEYHEIVLAHELGHNLNGIHIQADSFSGTWTIMGVSSPRFDYFSSGTVSATRNNAQRISQWGAINLHTLVWHQEGGNLGSYPDGSVYMTDLLVRVKDIPGVTTVIENVQFDLQFAVVGVTLLDRIFVDVTGPTGQSLDFGSLYNQYVGRVYVYHYSSPTSSAALSSGGQWRIQAAYYDEGHYCYYSYDPVYVKVFYVLGTISLKATPTFDANEYSMDIYGWLNPKSLLLFDFKVLCYRQSPTIGDVLYVYWAAFNTKSNAFPDFTYSSFKTYVALRSPDNTWKDFAHTTQYTKWAPRDTLLNDLNAYGQGNPGGGYCDFLSCSLQLSVAGTWNVIPDTYVDGYYPWYNDSGQYLQITLTVT